ncbi:MAG: VanW family protein [Candidatus Falkowbacteria bacterium]
MFLIKTKFLKPPRWLLDLAIIFFTISITSFFAYLIFEKTYDGKIYPGVWLDKIDLSGKTEEQAKEIINQKVDRINKDGITFYKEKIKTQIMPTVASAQSDFAYQIIDFDTESAVNKALNFGRDNYFFINLKNRIKAIAFGHVLKMPITINEKEIKKILQQNFSEKFEIPSKNAMLNYDFSISEEKLGKIIDYQRAIDKAKINLENLDASPIELLTKTDYPMLYKKDCINIEQKANKILNNAPLYLEYNTIQWIIYEKQMRDWLGLKIDPANENDKIIVGLNKEFLKKFLDEKVATKINNEPIDAKFEIKDGKVVEFQESRDGLELNIDASIEKIENDFIYNNRPEKNIKLITKELKSKIHTSGSNGFGVSEIIGTGESNFSGSPSNRRHNIKNGAETLNGILIKPDEEFSINNALGEINAETGYLPELVIKGNQTIAEYGGGLCQIGTTIFRAALQTGLPITMRRSHSYRVSYYEPAGTDATIYSPWPDMKFINDTGHHILIQSRIEGDNLYFDFWGTRDGRIVEVTEPTIYNITSPGPTKYVETLDLPVGEEKCTERAHNGADAYFDYKVVYADGEEKEERISSHYIPWQAVCLIGVEELTEVDEGIKEIDEAEKNE